MQKGESQKPRCYEPPSYCCLAYMASRDHLLTMFSHVQNREQNVIGAILVLLVVPYHFLTRFPSISLSFAQVQNSEQDVRGAILVLLVVPYRLPTMSLPFPYQLPRVQN